MLATSLKIATGTREVRIPEGVKGQAVVVGVDEAGRGPVLGPMVYSAAFWPLSVAEAMEAAGFDDSKALTEQERERLFQRMTETENLGWIIDELSADYISHSMLKASHPVSLNVTSHDTVIDMIRCIRSHGVNVTEVYVDTVGDPASYQARLTDAFDGQITFTVAKKADSLYKCVSAASIAAKVRRDKVIREWASKHEMVGDADFGSGYPSDERTKAWMVRHLQPVFGYPELVRFSWSTTKELLKSDGVPCRWLCEDEEDDAVDTQQITQFFSAAPKANGTTQSQGGARTKRRRTDYFHQRGLSLVHTLDL